MKLCDNTGMKRSLSISKISVFFGKITALNDVSLNLESGKIYGLVGANGAGKSTLLRVLAQLEVPHTGELKWGHEPLHIDSRGRGAEVAYVSENFDFYMWGPAKKMASNYQTFYPDWQAEVFNRLINEFGLNINQKFSSFSRGQKMQFCFALEAAKRCSLFLVDEITSVLDPRARKIVMDYLAEKAAQGCTIMISTNIVSEVEDIVEHVFCLDKGKVIIDCSTESWKGQLKKIRVHPSQSLCLDPSWVLLGKNKDGTVTYITHGSGLNHKIPLDTIPDQRALTIEEAFVFHTKSNKGEAA